MFFLRDKMADGSVDAETEFHKGQKAGRLLLYGGMIMLGVNQTFSS